MAELEFSLDRAETEKPPISDFSWLDTDAPVPEDVIRHAEGSYDPDIEEIINAMGQQVCYSNQREYSPTSPPIPIRRARPQ